MIRIMTVLMLVVLFILAGCKGAAKKSVPAAQGSHSSGKVILADGREVNESMVAELDAATTEEPETKVPDELIPIPADYEEEVAKKITAANMESELDALEVELSDE